MDPTLTYCKLDTASTYRSVSKERTDARASPNIHTQWVEEPSKGHPVLVWRERDPEPLEMEPKNNYSETSSLVDPESRLITPYGDGVPVNRYKWLEEYDQSLQNFFALILTFDVVE